MTPAEEALKALADMLDGTEPCRNDPEMWFADDPRWVETRDAKALCNGTKRRYDDADDPTGPCPARDACFKAGLLASTHGVWGGTDAAQREAIRDKHHLPAPDMGLRGPYDV